MSQVLVQYSMTADEFVSRNLDADGVNLVED
jgi:hypothetical protein